MEKTWKHKLIGTLNVFYIVLAVLFITDNFELLEVKTAFLKNFVHFGAIISTPILLFLNLAFFRLRKWSIPTGIISFLFCVAFGFVLAKRGVLGYLFSTSDWNTQTVHYRHKVQTNRTVEYQMKDVGALGYRSRIVEVFYITPWLMITTELDADPDRLVWSKTDEYLNELGLRE